MRKLLDWLPLPLLVVLCLTLGLAPFVPEPPLLEKLKMLVAGELGDPMDIFDLLLHDQLTGNQHLQLFQQMGFRHEGRETQRQAEHDQQRQRHPVE